MQDRPASSDDVGEAGVRSLSVVVPCLNVADTIEELLTQLNRESADFPDGIEVVLSDNGSTDGSDEIISRFAPAPALTIRTIDASHVRGPAHAINRGVEAASNDVVLIIGADDGLADGSALQLARTVAPGAVAVPRFDARSRHRGAVLYRSISQSDELGTMTLRERSGHDWTIPFFYNAGLMIHRTDFDAVGGFSESMLAGEDAEFCIRAALAGIGASFVPEASYLYYLKDNWRSVWRTGRTSGFAMTRIDEMYRPEYRLVIPSSGRVIAGQTRRWLAERSTTNWFALLFTVGRTFGRWEARWSSRFPTHH